MSPVHQASNRQWRLGFSLAEILIVVAIVAVLAGFVTLAILPANKKARDARRMFEINQVGRVLVPGCYAPEAGSGDYDLIPLLAELFAKRPQYASVIPQVPHDPLRGTASESFYRYTVDTATKKCSVYANLENSATKVTLPDLTAPLPGGGVGVLRAASSGWNGTALYFQYSN
ncbi:MAG: type II secretion system protein [Candidatus Liptonbacteria bacterium]|nr:type II secretion system protein [Candidatus Liptonbacteria bacterium]